jgi:hypothetical protein
VQHPVPPARVAVSNCAEAAVMTRLAVPIAKAILLQQVG